MEDNNTTNEIAAETSLNAKIRPIKITPIISPNNGISDRIKIIAAAGIAKLAGTLNIILNTNTVALATDPAIAETVSWPVM